MALKFTPPTIAVVYITKDKRGRITQNKKGANKKFHKQIPVDFENEPEPINIQFMAQKFQCEENKYLNPDVISLQYVMDLLDKLYKKYVLEKHTSETSAPKASDSPP